jgi:hypothetical protein
VESAPAEPKDVIDVPGITIQPASPIPTPKVEEGAVAQIEEPETPAPVEEPKAEDVGIPKPVEAQVPSLVEEKTEAHIATVEPVLSVPQVEEQVSAPIEIPAQVIDHRPICLRRNCNAIGPHEFNFVIMGFSHFERFAKSRTAVESKLSDLKRTKSWSDNENVR